MEALTLNRKIPWAVTHYGECPVYQDDDETKPEIGRKMFQRVKDYFASALETAAKETGVDIVIVPAGKRSLIFPENSFMSIVPEGQAEVILFDNTITEPFERSEKIAETYSKSVEIVKNSVAILPPK